MNEFIWLLSITLLITTPVALFGLIIGYVAEKLMLKRINDLLGDDLHGRL